MTLWQDGTTFNNNNKTDKGYWEHDIKYSTFRRNLDKNTFSKLKKKRKLKPSECFES